MNVAARVCRSPDSWPSTDHAQISLIHLPTPPKCSTRAILALINNLGIVYHQYCSSSGGLDVHNKTLLLLSDENRGTRCPQGHYHRRAMGIGGFDVHNKNYRPGDGNIVTQSPQQNLLPPGEGNSGTQSPQQKSLLLGSGRGGLNVHNNIITAGQWDRGTLHPQWHCCHGQ
jgi:hypothetical protein